MRKLKKWLPIVVIFIFFILTENVHSGVFVQAAYNNQTDNGNIIIIYQPESQTYVASQKVTAKVTAEGTGLKYQWQYRFKNWTNWINWSGEGATTAETSYNFPESFNGLRLRCVIVDAAGNSVTSDEAAYTLEKRLKITGQPKSQTYVANQKVTAKVTAEGTGLKYQWQYRFKNWTNWINWSGEGATTAETSYNFPDSFNGISLRCVLTDAFGNSVVSEQSTYSLIKNEDWELPIM